MESSHHPYYVAVGNSPMDYRDAHSSYVCVVEDPGDAAIFYFEKQDNGNSGGPAEFFVRVLVNRMNDLSTGWYGPTLPPFAN